MFPSRREFANTLRQRGPAWQAEADAPFRPVARPENERRLSGSSSDAFEAGFMREKGKDIEDSAEDSLTALRNVGLNSLSPWWVEPGPGLVLPRRKPSGPAESGDVVEHTMQTPAGVVVVGTPYKGANTSPPPLLPPSPFDIASLSTTDFPLPGTKMASGKMQGVFSDAKTPVASTLPIPSSMSVGSEASRQALKAHQDASLERVQAASRRLQGILLSDNPREFARQNPIPPRPPLTVNPALSHLRSSAPPPRPPPPPPPPANSQGSKLLDAALLGHDLEVHRMIKEAEARELRDAYMVGLKPCQDRPGFRQALSFHGKQLYGEPVRKIVTSISFHDLTPTLAGDYSDVRVLHYEAGFASNISLVCTDVNIPIGQQAGFAAESSSSASANAPETERWMSFVISVPFVAHSPGVRPILPPNMRGTIPASWVLIAVPIHAATVYPSVRESFTLHSPSGQEFVRTVKRTDYDFSRDFPPVFEFMDKEAVLGPVGAVLHRRIGKHFLNGTGLQSYERLNDVALVTSRPSGSSEDATKGQGSSSTIPSGEASNVSTPNRPAPDNKPKRPQPTAEQLAKTAEIDAMQAKMYKSRWWREAEVSFVGDWDDWNQIRSAMKNGNCRIVVRVDEAAEMAMAAVARQTRRLGISNTSGNHRGFRGSRGSRSSRGSNLGRGPPTTAERMDGPTESLPPPRPMIPQPHLGVKEDEEDADDEEDDEEQGQEKEESSPSSASPGPKKKKAKKSGRKRNNRRK